MGLSLEIVHWSDDDGEVLQILCDGDEIAATSTSGDCPEDNSVSRMGLPEMFEKVIEFTGWERLSVRRQPYGDMPWDN
jgi:hypothetical protein